ncbi:hypothetical protein ADEAN_000517200 [Angomonas deanei]|uniref:Uncharacterized protein n=1 Tax=Angomonas deanei TaxID=59799 RepID=A0A7G2CHJ8_9TRYP|nr:hypothetical protein ADEAN_000517200 [Angomonas deanei]
MRDFLRKVYNVDFYSNNDDLDFNELWAHMKELSTVETIENNVEVLQDQTPSVYEAIYRLKKKKGKKYEKALAKEKQNPKNYNRPRRGHSFHDTRSLPFYYQNVISGGLAKFIVSVDSLASLVLKGTLPLSTACVSLLGDLYLNENRRLMSRHNSGPVDTYFQQQLALHPLDIERELLAVMESKKTLQEMSSIRTASNEASQAAVARDIQSQHDEEEEGEDTITSTEEEEDVSAPLLCAPSQMISLSKVRSPLTPSPTRKARVSLLCMLTKRNHKKRQKKKRRLG